MAVKVMAIGAHNDECEYGLGGTAALLSDAGCEVRFVNPCGAFHAKDPTEADMALWKQQEQDAAQTLGASKIVYEPRTESLYRSDHDAVLRLADTILDFRPDILFVHYPEDNHIEHQMTARDSYEAFCLAHVKGTKIHEIYTFEAGPDQSGVYFVPELAIDVTSAMPRVKASLDCFNQPTAHGAGLNREKEIAALYRGHVHGFRYAECFKILKFPDGGDDFLLRQLLAPCFRWHGNGMYPAKGKEFF